MLTSCRNKSNDTPQDLPAEEKTMKVLEQATPEPFSSDDEKYTRALAEAPRDDDIPD